MIKRGYGFVAAPLILYAAILQHQDSIGKGKGFYPAILTLQIFQQPRTNGRIPGQGAAAIIQVGNDATQWFLRYKEGLSTDIITAASSLDRLVCRRYDLHRTISRN